MKLSGYIELIRQKLPKSCLLMEEVCRYWYRLCKYNASFSTNKDMRKMQYTLLREIHVIEKGMSMCNPKKGFGQAKVLALIERLSSYHTRYGVTDMAFMYYPLSTIKAYIAYQKQDNVEIADIEDAFSKLCNKTGISSYKLSLPAGINMQSAEDLQARAKGDFSSLLYSRHSIRYFQNKVPSKELLEKALSLAARTPSACNRQAWHTHIYFGEDSHNLLEMQGGCDGFCHDIPCSIVVTADMKGFLHYEPFQCYVDGGLYAMNLINALNYVGLGTIPLSCGFYHCKLSAIQQKFGIPENEVMVVIIGTGFITDKVKVAESTRRPIWTTNTYHT